MKTIKNKMTTIPMGHDKDGNKTDATVDYAFLLRACVNSPVQGGFTPEEMKKRIKLLDIVGEEDGKVKVDAEMKFEDAEFDHIFSLVKSMKWIFMHKDVVAFTEEIEKIKK